jgi:hypothetical protein
MEKSSGDEAIGRKITKKRLFWFSKKGGFLLPAKGIKSAFKLPRALT